MEVKEVVFGSTRVRTSSHHISLWRGEGGRTSRRPPPRTAKRSGRPCGWLAGGARALRVLSSRRRRRWQWRRLRRRVVVDRYGRSAARRYGAPGGRRPDGERARACARFYSVHYFQLCQFKTREALRRRVNRITVAGSTFPFRDYIGAGVYLFIFCFRLFTADTAGQRSRRVVWRRVFRRHISLALCATPSPSGFSRSYTIFYCFFIFNCVITRRYAPRETTGRRCPRAPGRIDACRRRRWCVSKRGMFRW